jgi:hypothetical protein
VEECFAHPFPIRSTEVSASYTFETGALIESS